MTISDIFAVRGEAEFRAGEARVILRLLESGPQVLATGGGAFMNPDTRARDRRQGHLDLAQGRIRRADEAHQAPPRPAAAQDRRPRRDAAQAHRGALIRSMRWPISPCSRARCCTTRSSTRSWARLPAGWEPRARHRARPPTEATSHDCSAARQRSDHRQRRARRAQLRHRHRPRPAGFAGPKNSGAAARGQSRDRHRRNRREPPSRGGRGRRLPPPASLPRP